MSGFARLLDTNIPRMIITHMFMPSLGVHFSHALDYFNGCVHTIHGCPMQAVCMVLDYFNGCVNSYHPWMLDASGLHGSMGVRCTQFAWFLTTSMVYSYYPWMLDASSLHGLGTSWQTWLALDQSSP